VSEPTVKMTISINGVDCKVKHDRTVSYETLCRLAGREIEDLPVILYSAGPLLAGIVHPGEHAPLKYGAAYIVQSNNRYDEIMGK